MVQIVPTRDVGVITRTKVTKVTRELVEVSRGEDITPMQTKTRVVGPVVGATVTNPHRETSGQEQGNNLRSDDMLLLHPSFLLTTST